jgi:hypothetical protein
LELTRGSKGYPEHRIANDDDNTLSFGTKRAAVDRRSDFVSSADAARCDSDFVSSTGSDTDHHNDPRACSLRILMGMEPEQAGGAFAREGRSS